MKKKINQAVVNTINDILDPQDFTFALKESKKHKGKWYVKGKLKRSPYFDTRQEAKDFIIKMLKIV